MLNKYLDKNKLIENYNIGDKVWLEELKSEIEIIKTESEEELDILHNSLNLRDLLLEMNYIICQCECKEYAEKYYSRISDLYTEMKVDLTKMLEIEEIWEEI